MSCARWLLLCWPGLGWPPSRVSPAMRNTFAEPMHDVACKAPGTSIPAHHSSQSEVFHNFVIKIKSLLRDIPPGLFTRIADAVHQIHVQFRGRIGFGSFFHATTTISLHRNLRNCLRMQCILTLLPFVVCLIHYYSSFVEIVEFR